MVIQYRGTLFFGSQVQADKPTIAGELARAIARFSDTVPKLEFASRTDTGVHALGQVVSFILPTNFPPVAHLGKILNNYLTDDVRVTQSYCQSNQFHARFSAVKRDYCYCIYHGRRPNLEFAWKSWHLPEILCWNHSNKVLDALKTRKDWQGFCTQPADNYGFLAPLEKLEVKQSRTWSKLYFCGRRYLYKMLVNITGLLVATSLGKINPEKAMLIATGALPFNLAPAPAKGLCLLKVHYK